jgi:hypothetical protein
MPPPPERAGTPLRISGQRINFSQWPTRKGGRGYVLQPEVLSNAPWDVIEYAIKGKYGSRSSNRKVCLSFLEQAKAFYFASETYDEAARPLLLYYSFLNLAKCFIQYTGTEPDLDNAQHGLWERRGREAFFGSTVNAAKTSATKKNVFDLLGQSLGLNALSTNKSYKVIKHLIPQIVIGHRLWSSASAKAQKFVRCDRISFRHHKGQRHIWIRILIRRDDIRSCNLASLLAVYALVFYLGSVARYRPYEYENIKDSIYGMFIAEFIETQGQQFWYALASEFLKQSVSLPAVLH